VRAMEGWVAQGLKAIAAAATGGDSVVAALFSATRPAVAVIARSRNVSVDTSAVLKELVQRFGGRGGGKPELAQGGGLDEDAEKVVAATLEIIGSQLSRV
jgi:alanyl-tRNA synthetase